MKQLTGYIHGINLGGWLSQCTHTKEHYDTFISEEDVKTVSEWKLDHVRVPVDYNLVQNLNGTFKEDGFKYIQNVIDWCGKYKLNMILDLHKTAGFSFDVGEKEIGFFENEKYQNQFYSLWEEFARRYSKYEDRLCFELLNEVTDQSFSKKWNEIAKNCITKIRAIAPTIKILIGSYWNNSVTSIKDLDAPYDENIVFNFHCYDPLIFTHQRAYWVGPKMNPDFVIPFETTFADLTKYTKEKLNPGLGTYEAFPQDKHVDEDYFETILSEALEVAKKYDVALYCGEYGVIDKVDPKEAIKWYKAFCSVLDRHGIGRAAWNFKKMDFGISDSRLDGYRDELLKLL